MKCILITAMPLYQKIIDQATVTANNSNGTISRGSIYCPEQLSVSSVSIDTNAI